MTYEVDPDNEYFEKKDALWIGFHCLWDSILIRRYPLDVLIKKLFVMSYALLNKYHKKEDLKDIVASFENIFNLVIAYYSDYFDNSIWNEPLVNSIIISFDSLIFDYPYTQSIKMLKEDLKKFLKRESLIESD